jgi:hypothetical protein
MPHHYSEGEIQADMDKRAVEAVLDRYFYGLGCLDPEIMLTCFTEDAKFGPSVGTDAMRKSFQQIGDFQHAYVMPVTRNIIIEGDVAHSDMLAVGFVLRGDSEGPQGKIKSNGIRYKDTLVRTEDGWKIKYRRGTQAEEKAHDTFWQFDVASTALPPG